MLHFLREKDQVSTVEAIQVGRAPMKGIEEGQDVELSAAPEQPVEGGAEPIRDGTGV